MADQRYIMSVTIQITGTETKKNTVRDAILAKLNDALVAGNIDQADWNISQNVVPEGGVVKP